MLAQEKISSRLSYTPQSIPVTHQTIVLAIAMHLSRQVGLHLKVRSSASVNKNVRFAYLNLKIERV
jgi:uncharacterized membrane protein